MAVPLEEQGVVPAEHRQEPDWGQQERVERDAGGAEANPRIPRRTVAIVPQPQDTENEQY